MVVLPASPRAKGTEKMLRVTPHDEICPGTAGPCQSREMERLVWSGLGFTCPVTCLWHSPCRRLGSSIPQGVFRGVPPQFSSPQPPALLAGAAFAHSPARGGAVGMHSVIVPKHSMSLFIFLAVTISCSKKVPRFNYRLCQMSFPFVCSKPAASTGISQGSRCFRRGRNPPNAFNALFAFALVTRVLRNR